MFPAEMHPVHYSDGDTEEKQGRRSTLRGRRVMQEREGHMN